MIRKSIFSEIQGEDARKIKVTYRKGDTMTEKILGKDKLADALGKLKEKCLYMPVSHEDSVRFERITEGVEPTLEFGNSSMPSKNISFPQTETLFRFKMNEDAVCAVHENEEILVLGIRNCDARAMAIVDKLFGWDFDDPYVQEKRSKMTLVGLACSEPPSVNCFCTSMGGNPFSKEALDALMVDMGEKYHIESLTENGENFLSAIEDFCESASGESEAIKEMEENSAKMMKRSIDTEGVREKLESLWEGKIWEDVHKACLGCGTCTFLCPTCHCFDIQDEVEGDNGRRARMWDSCMFAEYTIHASDHNPRATRKERTRNRISHKYWYYVDKFDVIACVGCGRCINYCPVNIDIIDIIEKVRSS